jgi:hypothetical protein
MNKYAKLDETNTNVLSYPLYLFEIIKFHPRLNFKSTDKDLSRFNIVKVYDSPVIDKKDGFNVIEGTPKLVGKKWTQVWEYIEE